ncbi:unnamed protein product [Linum tenue]|uniref:Ubiquitin-like-conjugating enzyme ATG10 n=1 Tax=Linum tenue TaxID=586396 RepID=A0AAV0HYZ0_9ROSI|nr:unnamed protein product [Linum tenue]
MNESAWDGTLSASEFSASAQAFAEKWKLNNPAYPPWTWVKSLEVPIFATNQQVEEGYLSLENVCIVKSNDDEVASCVEGEASLYDKEDEESTDSATLPYYFDFHIIYSASFRVPVLYFRAYCSDGRSLGLNEIESVLPANSAKVLLESKWTFITQEEHPYLNRPWCKLHPCGSSDWMKLLFQAVEKVDRPAMELYLVSWFSVVGPVIGLGIPIQMLKEP